MTAVDEIKQRLDIVDVVSEYVTLHKAGRNLKALCPFHAEKTPSFFVFPDRQTWHCFGSCGTGGDVFSFVMKREGIGFGEVLTLLADRAGVTLPRRGGKAAEDREREDSERERLYQANEAAAHYYHQLLLGSAGAEAARRHLSQRGISRETVDGFELGFSPDSWNALLAYLQGRGYAETELVAAGLVSKREGGSAHDLFRKRLMIPIRNVRGRVAGFGGRTLDDSSPKYLNSPQSAVFDKSGMLYGIDRAREAIGRQDVVVIVEGYMDVLTAHQHGMTNVVASMGTSLTEKQVATLRPLTNKLVLALDADAAGDVATLRGLDVVRRAFAQARGTVPDSLGATFAVGGSLSITRLPRGQDPDEVIKANPAEWERLVAGAKPFMEFLIDDYLDAVTSPGGMPEVEAKVRAAEQLLPILRAVGNKVEREVYLNRMARKLGVDQRTLAERAARLQPTAREKPARAASVVTAQAGQYGLEEYYLSLLLQHPDLRPGGERVSPDCFECTENREIFLAWRETPDGGSVHERLDDSLREHLGTLVERSMPPASGKELEVALSDCARRLEERRLRRLKALETTLIAEAESEGNVEEVQALLQRSLEPNIGLRNLHLQRDRAGKGAKL